VPLGEAENRPSLLLVGGRSMARADAEVGRRDGHRVGRLAEVVLEQGRLPVVRRLGRHDGDRRRGPGDVPGPLPDLRQLDELRPVSRDHEVPRLPVAGRRRPAPGLEDAVERLVRNRLVGELPDVSSCAQGVPGLHADILRPRRRFGDPLPRASPAQPPRSGGGLCAVHLRGLANRCPEA